jgi:heme-degrading monooxygenase HmoA
MYAKVRSFQSHSGRLDERLKHSIEVTLPFARRLPGFQGALILANRETHRTVSVILWETEADLLAAERNEEYQRLLPEHQFAAGEVQTGYLELVSERPARGARYAIVRSYEVHSGRMDARVKHGIEVSLPFARQLPGFQGVLIFANRELHQTLSVVLWETEADLLAAQHNEEYQRLLPEHQFAAGEIQTEYFEVSHEE